jgi:hypothetical protein
MAKVYLGTYTEEQTGKIKDALQGNSYLGFDVRTAKEYKGHYAVTVVATRETERTITDTEIFVIISHVLAESL